ncbi:alcohol dehydrogenase [Loktanella sp. 5RATIMAR09]|uniref:iron-containing alcohol dehydrogenase n=1 Tax=Loktanella sp. 5RATIMAR09 TaxID=1225655 RepID=UPI0006EBABDE|nr:iron-containing alcohol dehydrogenase [Loktanella sp. 5RATIMAR09]KQI70762.1 alcohol dehydrogenase [Loktanella sp. 5RATIMAR09]
MFSFLSPHTLHFGRGQSAQTAALAKSYGTAVLLVHGSRPSRAQWLVTSCEEAGLRTTTLSCHHEPSLPDITAALDHLGDVRPDVIVALGGGSVIDFAKALAALIACEGEASEYLEVVGNGRPLEHAPIPMIALPTTAGTGAEVTKNAVISVPERGIKVSLRDGRMIPQIAIVDAALMEGAPKTVTLAAALDAVTQVIEPYLSVKANPMTDALCVAAIPKGLSSLRDLVENGTPDAWDNMAWVSTCGGLALANSGLGAVHGFAGVIGGRTNAPHGEICGALLPAILKSHLGKAEKGTEIYNRLEWVETLCDAQFAPNEPGQGISALASWSKGQGLRGLGEMGLSLEDHAQVADAASNASSMKGNPFALTKEELVAILCEAH